MTQRSIMGEITLYTLLFGFMLYSKQGQRDLREEIRHNFNNLQCAILSTTASTVWINSTSFYREIMERKVAPSDSSSSQQASQ